MRPSNKQFVDRSYADRTGWVVLAGFKVMAAYHCGTAANYDFAKLSSFRPKQLGEAIATQ